MRLPTHPRRGLQTLLPVLALSCAFGLGTTSCGGGGGGGGGENPDLVLLGFNQPNVSGVSLNQPLVFTFSADIDPLSITPDTLRVVGLIGPFFEETIVDGNLIALLPRSPNFDDYSDAGLAPDTTYSVSMPTFPAVDTIQSVGHKPLLTAGTFQFHTVPAASLQVPRYAFLETRRRLVHGLPPSANGDSDDEGCVQNRGQSLYVDPFPAISSADPLPQQTNSLPGGRLLCLENEGAPHVIPEECVPLHDRRAVGTPSAGSQNVGRVDLPALVLSINEQVDPATVTPYDPVNQVSFNLQLWRVALLDGTPLLPPDAIEVNKPLLVQKQGSTQLILVASAPVLQGIYLINATASVLDLSQKPLVINDDADLTGTVYAGLDAGLPPQVPPGWRLYFQTLQLPNTASALSETFGSNLAEWGDASSALTEPGVFTWSSPVEPAANPHDPLAAIANILPVGMATPAFTLLFGPNPGEALDCGQSTTANWNNGFRFLNLSSLDVNTDADSGVGRLKATFKPYTGDGGDGALDTDAPPFTNGPGDTLALVTTPGPGASTNSDGIFEYESFHLRKGDTLSVSGTRPLLILCRGDFQVDGTIDLSGQDGRFGLDTDGSTDYTNPGSIAPWGAGGAAGPGGGAGGRGAGPIVAPQAVAVGGNAPENLFGLEFTSGGFLGQSNDDNPSGGGGGGHSAAGGTGGNTNGAVPNNGGFDYGTPLLERDLSFFTPDRGYSPNSGCVGGAGGAGGGADDDDGGIETPGSGFIDNGDDAGGGGGGGGGAIWVIAGGEVRVGEYGVIRADGGDGGSTYHRDDTKIEPGPDGEPGGGDDFASGLRLTTDHVPAGGGGPGGGGAGGAIFLVGETGVDIQPAVTMGAPGATLSAVGGNGGTSGDGDLYGGAGSSGRIVLMDIAASGISNLGPPPTPAASTFTWRPTVRLDSVGQSAWIDLFVPTVDWAPIVNTVAQVPFTTDNFQFLVDLGLVRGPTDDFDALFEYQGADTLTPVPGVGTPTSATGLTQWNADINAADGKRYFRWRCRFHVSSTYPATGMLANPLPSVTDLTIPLEK
jgi:hypothetical protein